MMDILIRILLIMGCVVGFLTLCIMVYYNTKSYFIDKHNKKELEK